MSDAFAILFALAAFSVPWLFGVWAFARTGQLRRELAAARARILSLEQAIGLAPLTGAQLTPAPAATPIRPAPTRTSVVEPSVSPAAPAIPKIEPAPKRPQPSLSARLEKAIAANWLVWIGAVLILFAIASTLRFAVEQKWFGPAAQLIAACVLSVALFGASEWVRRRPPAFALSRTQLRHLPAILAALGLFALFAATYAGVANFQIIPIAIGFVVLALIAVAAIVMSLGYGPWFAALGLGAGYLAPILVHFQRPSTAALFGYILALTAAALAVIKLRQWKGFVWLASGGAIAWALYWLSTPYGPRAFGDAAFFVVGLAMLGMAFAWNEASAPVPLRDIAKRKPPWTESMFAAHVMFGASMLILQGLLQRSHDPTIVTAILAFCVVSAVIASIREGFGLMPLGAGLLGISMVAGWPVRSYDAPIEIAAMFRAAGALGFIFSGGGWLMMARNRSAGLGAALAALGPVGVVVAAHEAGGFLRTAIWWAAPALMLAAINTFALERLSRRLGGIDRAPGASAAFALGAAGSLLFATYFLLEQQGLWLTGALAAMIPVMAWLDLRLKLPVLRIPISATAFVVLWRLVVMFQPLKVSPTPIFNELLPGFGLAAIALYLAARFYRHASAAPRLVDTLEAGALIAFAVGISWEVRHIATSGNLLAPGVTLAEAGGYSIAWLSSALGLAARFGAKPRRALSLAEALFAGIGAAFALWSGYLILNPWWGEAPAPVPGWPIFNVLLVAYAIPASLCAAYATLKRRHGDVWRARLAGGAATLLFFANVTLEVRRWFHPLNLADGAIGPVEAWAYTAAWIVFAAALLGLGLKLSRPSLRYASLAVLLAAVIKAFGFDMSALTGLLRGASYLGLGAAILVVALVYQRYVFPKGFAKPES